MNEAVVWSYAVANLMWQVPLLSHSVFMRSRIIILVPADQNICKQRGYLLFLPNSILFIINSVILSLQLDRDI